jgi:hypothetical protein
MWLHLQVDLLQSEVILWRSEKTIL